MLPTVRSPLGAPGAFVLPEAPAPALHPQRMDGCAFFGVAPRGPARVPVADGLWPAGWRRVVDADAGTRPLRRNVPVCVRSFDEYVHHFGGFDGPGLLPHAVASYFEQGGRVAWVLRIVAALMLPGGRFDTDCARGTLPAGALATNFGFIARNPGTWGNALAVQVGFEAETVAFERGPAAALWLPINSAIAVGSTLRLTDVDGVSTLALCTALRRQRDPERAREHWAVTLDAAPPAVLRRTELVTLALDVHDGAGRRERHARLGLAPDHPRGLASVLCEESSLLWPAPDWAGQVLWPALPQVETLRGRTLPFAGGVDRWADIVADDFFDSDWSTAAEEAGAGITAIVHTEGVTQLVLPDLYVPAAWAEPPPLAAQDAGTAGAEFGECVPVPGQPAVAAVAPVALSGLLLDPRTEAGLAAVIARQQQVADFCAATRNHIALLDVPPGLSQARIERWRAAFDSPWLAAYHPWLIGTRRPGDAAGRVDAFAGQEGTAGRARQLPPSAVAAGIVARKELAFGLQAGPANEVARQVVHCAEPQPTGRADVLHPLGVNCFAREPQGWVLTGARTLARDADWRQLSVRRLVLMIERALLAQMQWAVFEPLGPALARDLVGAVQGLLRGLFRAGTFAGTSESESFFVRVQDERARLDRGELVLDIGVAPAEPLEFILLRLRRDGDGTLRFED